MMARHRSLKINQAKSRSPLCVLHNGVYTSFEQVLQVQLSRMSMDYQCTSPYLYVTLRLRIVSVPILTVNGRARLLRDHS